MVLASGVRLSFAASADSEASLPVPRFVSLHADRVNLRTGPGDRYPIEWVLTRKEMPVEITGQLEHWRRIRDWEGAEGWVLHSLLSGKRTALVSAVAKKIDDFAPIHASADRTSAVTARLQSGVIATVKRCDGHWCRISGEGFDGWIEQERLWGVYPGEKVD